MTNLKKLLGKVDPKLAEKVKHVVELAIWCRGDEPHLGINALADAHNIEARDIVDAIILDIKEHLFNH